MNSERNIRKSLLIMIVHYLRKICADYLHICYLLLIGDTQFRSLGSHIFVHVEETVWVIGCQFLFSRLGKCIKKRIDTKNVSLVQ